jgi:membrane protein
MHESSSDGLIRKAIRLFREIRALHITTYAGYASFFIVLAVFPTLVLILGLLQYTPLDSSDLLALLEGFLPDTLQSYAWSLLSVGYANTTRTVISVSALAALWSAGKGIYGLMKGLNAVYGVTEHRGWLRTRLLCAAYMVAFLLVLLLTLVLHVFGNTLVLFLQHRGGKLAWLGSDLLGLRYFLLVAVQTLLFAVMFMYLPGVNNCFRESLPGALFGSFGWMTVSGAFSIYMEHYAGYTRIFGPVYVLALAMLWLYICVNTLFLGGVLNRFLKRIG